MPLLEHLELLLQIAILLLQQADLDEVLVLLLLVELPLGLAARVPSEATVVALQDFDELSLLGLHCLDLLLEHLNLLVLVVRLL